MADKKQTPKSQARLSQDSIKNYKHPETGTPINEKYAVDKLKSRANQVSRKDDKVKNLTVNYCQKQTIQPPRNSYQ